MSSRGSMSNAAAQGILATAVTVATLASNAGVREGLQFHPIRLPSNAFISGQQRAQDV